MKKIKPFSIWQNGIMVTATSIDLHLNFDDLSSVAIFYYSLKNDAGNPILDNNITMDGKDYSNWNGSSTEAYDWACKKLNITYQ